MGSSPGNWLAAHRADFTLAKTVICIFVANATVNSSENVNHNLSK